MDQLLTEHLDHGKVDRHEKQTFLFLPYTFVIKIEFLYVIRLINVHRVWMSTIPSGAVKFSDLQSVLGGSNPIKFSEYYANATEGYSSGVSDIPNKNSAIKMSVFRGKSKSTTPLYTFTSHTFTNAGASGRTGPTLAQCRSAYSSTSWASSYLNMTNNDGIQLWTVPVTGNYTITTAGAKGGDAVSGYVGGRGRIITSTIALTRGQIIKILVGQAGARYGGYGDYGNQYMGGGGGGTFVVDNNNNPLLISGGGGGGVYSALLPAGGNGMNAPSASTTLGTNAYQYTATNSYVRNNYGSNSYGGTTEGSGSSGGGLNGDGVKGFWGGEPGKGFINGGTGGSNANYSSFPLSEYGTGGFGGGAGCGIHLNHENNAGAGGGYSGGAGGGGQVGNGGGGGNYTSGTGVTDGGLNNGNGYVTITSIVDNLYAFTSHTFTNAGATGASGPTLAQVQSAYNGQTWAQSTANLNVSGGIQIWTVPKTKTYTITARGARGGKMSSSYSVGGGFGATISASFSLTQGEKLYLVVGQMGIGNTSGSGGGGGSWVVKENGTLLLVAGGGGGAGHDTGWGAGGSTSTSANNSSGGHGCNTTSTTGYGGGAGLKGPDNTYNFSGAGGGGAGWLGDGTSVSGGTGSGGLRYANGAGGGAQVQAGGFGGGGGAGGSGFAGGGGGGYTGGGGGNDYIWGSTSATTGDVSGSTDCWGGGGGGGSYYSGSLVSSTAGTSGANDNTTDQHGYITIQ